MNYTQTLEWMFAKLPMYQSKGRAALHHKLDNILALCKHLGNPQNSFKSIHVAGTNGKGSSSHMLASVLQHAGYKVGLYTSPHLKDFSERIKISGLAVPESFIISFIKENKQVLEQLGVSFFEMSVAMAFSYFEKQNVDIAVIEVGLGGRFDSTNIIRPLISLITNIGLDHTDILGETLSDIAYQKAGIIKENTPVVISESHPQTMPVFKEVAHKCNAPISFADTLALPLYKTDLLGTYQSKNIKGVLQTIALVTNYFTISQDAIQKGLASVVTTTGLLGRWQILQQYPKVICDTAHNKEGLLQTMHQLQQESFKKLHLVFGVVKDKKLDTILPLLPKDALYYFCAPDIARALPVQNLQQQASAFGLKGDVFSSVSEAYKASLLNASKQDVVYIGGSTFIVAEII